jgi:AraC-like DNA-binding protein
MLELIQDLSGVRTVIYDRAHFTERAGRRRIDRAFMGHRSDFCQSLRVTEEGEAACVACDVEEGTREAAAHRGPFLHTCHAGLTEVVFPVIYRGEHVATVFCGQVAVEGCPAEDAAWLRRRARRVGASPRKVAREYAKLPRVSGGRLLRIAEMLFNALNYLAESEGRAGLERTFRLNRYPLVRDAIAFVDARFAEPVGLREAAEHCCVAPEHLSRLFHRVAGVTFSAHLTGRRMERARELLRTTTLDMSSIAAQCGYAHQSYFGRKFKQDNGLTPRQYRTQHAPRPADRSK